MITSLLVFAIIASLTRIGWKFNDSMEGSPELFFSMGSDALIAGMAFYVLLAQ